jgi:O-antigen ligase/polysaccharide polymerase Wzy-like membrane protein
VIAGGAFAGIAFAAKGGTELTRTTITEIVIVLVSGCIVAAAFLWGHRSTSYGVTTLLFFTLLAFLTAASVLWSITPELTYIEAGRTFAYLALFGAAVAVGRLAPRAAPALLIAILIGAVVPVAYGLASRIWPGALAENEVSNRLGQPFDYWNALGCVAAMAVPISLWLGSRRTGSSSARMLAYPAMGACVLAILLTQSRGAAAAALLGAVIWFALVPLRLRSLPVILIPSALASGVAVWALSKDPFSKSLQPISAKEVVADEFGVLVLLMLALLLLAGAAVEATSARRVPSARLRRRIGIVTVAVACLAPLVAFTSVAFSDRGLGDRLDELTSETQVAPKEGGGRVFAAASSRGKYWREAFHVFGARTFKGVGAGDFAVARLRYRTDDSVTRHAHGWIPQTAADLGILGLIVTTALGAAWLLAALSATNLLPRRWVRDKQGEDDDELPPRRDWDDARIAIVTVAIVPVVFALQSLVDWTWFVPAPTTMALVAGGFVAGRDPQWARDDAPAEPIRWRPGRNRIVLAVATLLTAGLLAWATWQPEASDRATNDALALADQHKFDRALERTKDAEDLNSLTPDPLLVRASVDTMAGRDDAARDSLEEAVIRFPGDPQTWYRLAAFELGTLDAPEQALETLKGLLYIDPHSNPGRNLFLDARARLREKTGTSQPDVNQ